MVKDYKCIGVPFTNVATDGKKKQEESMTVEKWPLIQSYAAEGFGQ